MPRRWELRRGLAVRAGPGARPGARRRSLNATAVSKPAREAFPAFSERQGRAAAGPGCIDVTPDAVPVISPVDTRPGLLHRHRLLGPRLRHRARRRAARRRPRDRQRPDRRSDAVPLLALHRRLADRADQRRLKAGHWRKQRQETPLLPMTRRCAASVPDGAGSRPPDAAACSGMGLRPALPVWMRPGARLGRRPVARPPASPRARSWSAISQEPTVFNPLMLHIEVDEGVYFNIFNPLWSVDPDGKLYPRARGRGADRGERRHLRGRPELARQAARRREMARRHAVHRRGREVHARAHQQPGLPRRPPRRATSWCATSGGRARPRSPGGWRSAYAPYAAILAWTFIVPKHVLDKAADPNTAPFNNAPIGTGPFNWVERVAGRPHRAGRQRRLLRRGPVSRAADLQVHPGPDRAVHPVPDRRRRLYRPPGHHRRPLRGGREASPTAS